MSDFSINCNPAFTEEPEERTQCDCCGQYFDTVIAVSHGVILCEECLKHHRLTVRHMLIDAVLQAADRMSDTERAVLLDDDLIAGDAMDEAMEKIRGYYK